MAILSKDEQQRISEAVAAAEKASSGEIIVALQKTVKGEIYEEAKAFFDKKKLYETRDRNGILIFLAFNKHQIAVLGDQGINEKVPEDYWQQIIDEMIGEFKQGNLCEGLVLGVNKIGEKLTELFPYRDDDQNELSDEVHIED